MSNFTIKFLKILICINLLLTFQICFAGAGLGISGVFINETSDMVPVVSNWATKIEDLSAKEQKQLNSNFSNLRKAYYSKSLSEEHVRHNKIAYSIFIQSGMMDYLPLRQMLEQLKYYPNQTLRNLPQSEWKVFINKLTKAIKPLEDKLRYLREIDPSAFDKYIYKSLRTTLMCDCSSYIQTAISHPNDFIALGQDLKSKDFSIRNVTQAILKNCSEQVTIANYKVNGSCTDPYIDKILNQKNGIFDGYKNIEIVFDPTDNASDVMNSPLEGCPLAAIDTYSAEVIQTTIPGNYTLGKGEAALNKPCTLLMLNYDVKDQKLSSGPKRIINSLRYKGPNKDEKPKSLNRKENHYELDQIMAHWDVINRSRNNTNNIESNSSDSAQ